MVYKVRKGIFIVCEGGEGSGKTSQIKLLEKKLIDNGYSVLLTREPGGTGCNIGEEIRSILKNPRFKDMTPETELFLFLASRAQHVKIINNAINSGKIVISDRFEASTFAYQHFGRGLFDLEEVIKINSFATGGLIPDLTLLLDINPEDGIKRIQENSDRGNVQDDRFDSEVMDFHYRVRNGFLYLAEKLHNWKIVNANDSIDNVHFNIWNYVKNCLSSNSQPQKEGGRNDV